MDNPKKRAFLEAVEGAQEHGQPGAPVPPDVFLADRGRVVRRRRTTSRATTRVWRCMLNAREVAWFFHRDPKLRRLFRDQLIHVIANEMVLNRCDRCELYDPYGTPIAEYALPR